MAIPVVWRLRVHGCLTFALKPVMRGNFKTIVRRELILDGMYFVSATLQHIYDQ